MAFSYTRYPCTGWPLTGEAVEAGRGALLSALETSPFFAPEPETFRVLIPSPGSAELWVLVARARGADALSETMEDD